MIGTAAMYRDLGKYYGQNRVSYCGGLLGGALASRPPPPPVYYAPAPVYVEEPACRLVRERFWDGYGWQVRRVQVCDWSQNCSAFPA